MFQADRPCVFIIYPFKDSIEIEKCIKKISNEFRHLTFSFVKWKKRFTGEEWLENVKKEICKSEFVMMFLRSDGSATNNMMQESNFARSKEIPIIEVKKKQRANCVEIIEQFLSEQLEAKAIKNLSIRSTRNIDKEILKSQYELLVNSSEALINRRQTTCDRFSVVCCAIIALIGSMELLNNSESSWMFIILSLLSMVGILFSIAWLKFIESCGKINRSKYRMMHLIERRLSARLFYAEWEDMVDPIRGGYTSYSNSEKMIPSIFMILFTVIAMAYVLFYFLN